MNENKMEHEAEVRRLAARAADAVKALADCVEHPGEGREDRCRRKRREYAKRRLDRPGMREAWNKYVRDRYHAKKAETAAAKENAA